MGSSMDLQLQYLNYSSLINPSFWHKLSDVKLNVDRLEARERAIWAYMPFILNEHQDRQDKCFLNVSSTSFNKHFDQDEASLVFKGKILYKNTIEDFKECDKNALMQEQAEDLEEIIRGENVIKNPFLLNNFFVLIFADLKKYHYYYWFAFPAPLALDVRFRQGNLLQFSDEQKIRTLETFKQLQLHQRALFVIKNTGEIVSLAAAISDDLISDENCFSFGLVNIIPSSLENIICSSLKNVVLLLATNPEFKCLRGKLVRFVFLRFKRKLSQLSIDSSHVLALEVPESCGDGRWIGWERNERNNMGPRMVNMKNSMQPEQLMESAVDLNLKLMKWRLLPDIDLERIKLLKCLLLGSGTLGCSVARVLLGWGVRQIDFVDNGYVSYSNPVRQSLFTFEDCKKSRAKAPAAAERLKEIFPGIESKGYNLNIPMPGHPVGQSMLEDTRNNVQQLNELISAADVVFLLMDSRESRWLPTLLGQVHRTIVINAALGFDTYLVMRHGLANCEPEPKSIEGFNVIKGNELGCYFCNDVTAPGNSLKQRTLDQQCTVTRPGVNQIAGALAVELAISLSQHPQGAGAPSYYKKPKTALEPDRASEEREDECILGLLPHSIRGFLSDFTQLMPATQKYKQCIACSDLVVQKYKAEGFDFLLDVFRSSKVLEDLTGLSELHQMDHSDVWGLSDTEDFE